MTLAVSITQDEVLTKLGDFIATVITGVPVIQLPVNRVSMPPASPGFIGMRPLLQGRIATNFTTWGDVLPTTLQLEQPIRYPVQLDCYGASAAEWAVILSTVLRDSYGVEELKPILAPLYAEDPRFAPLVDGEEEYETRWIVGAVLQYNPVVTAPQQFADTVTAALINVDESYPP